MDVKTVSPGNFQQTKEDHHTVANKDNTRNTSVSLYSEFGKKIDEVTNGTKTVTAEQCKN